MSAVLIPELPADPGDPHTSAPPPRPDAEPARLPRPGRGRARQGAIAFIAYLGVSFLLYGLPVLRDYATTFAGKGAGDSRIFLWGFAWWPHAISHGLSPVVTHAIYEPSGVNLAWTTSIPGPAIIFWPITKAFGPLVSMNLATMLAPALAAWGAYLVCRRISSRFIPALVAGYLFGFSSYMTEQLTGHVNLFLIFPVPLAVYLVIRRIDGSLPVGRFVVGLGLLLVLQFSISTEVFATLSFFGGVAMLGAMVAVRGHRVQVASAAAWTVAAFAIAGVILIPLLTFVLKGAPARPIRPVISGSSSVDLASFFVPRRSTLIGGATFHTYTDHTLGTPAEQGAYLPLPLIALLIAAAWMLRKDRMTRWTLAFGIVVLVFSLGTYLHVNGQRLFPMPWTPFAHVPILADALPSRFMMFAGLAIAVVAARWIDASEQPWGRVGVAALAGVMLLPNIAGEDVHTPLQVPAFFTNGGYRHFIPEDHTILYIHSDKGGEMLAQVEAHFWFRLAQGHTGPTPRVFQRTAGYHAIDSGYPTDLSPSTVATFIRTHHVTTVVVQDGLARLWAPVLGAATHVVPIATGGVQVYEVRSGPPPVRHGPGPTRPGTHRSRGTGRRAPRRSPSHGTTAKAGRSGRTTRSR
ncbi:MAG: hypothetical protein QOI81_743 [Actinomycetota bacterium]|nr:hypothetical protein [Actinomycetota bacterium]